MDMQVAEAGIEDGIAGISQQIWEAKYRLKALGGTPVDRTIEDSWRARRSRPRGALGRSRTLGAGVHRGAGDFRFLPGGRILSGADSGRRVALAATCRLWSRRSAASSSGTRSRRGSCKSPTRWPAPPRPRHPPAAATHLGPVCPCCSQPGLVKEAGCLSCLHRGWSKCG